MPLYDARLLETPDLAERVLALLSAKEALPSFGIVAGQAVASAIDEILGTGPAVYNDIDVFLEARDWQAVTGDESTLPNVPERRQLAPTPEFMSRPDLEALDYVLAVNVIHRKRYRIIKTARCGLMNYVLTRYITERYDSRGTKATQLIDVFDMNSIQVAIDLESRTLVYSRHYAAYFAGRELAIANLYTPFQSLLRYFKKRAELKAYGNDDLQIEMVRRIVYANEGDPIYREERIDAFRKGLLWIPFDKSAELVTRRYGWTPKEKLFRKTGEGTEGLPLAIGVKYEALLGYCSDKLEPYFEVHKHPRINMWLMSTRPDAPRLPELPADLVTVPSVMAARFRELRLPASRTVCERRAEFTKFLAWLDDDLRHMYAMAYRYYGDAFLEGIESERGWRDLYKVLTRHSEVAGAVLMLKFRDQMLLVRRVRAILRRLNQPNAWGVFRGMDEVRARRALSDDAWLQEEITRQLGTNQTLVPERCRLPLPAMLGPVSVRELVETWDLLSEGSRLHHCVGGYSDAVRRGRSRIVSLSAGDTTRQRSTVEWQPVRTQVKRSGGKGRLAKVTVACVRLVQHRSFANSNPIAVLEETEEKLRTDVNAWLEAHPEEGLKLLDVEECAGSSDDYYD